jgi:formylglycine-generating enzyme required for sulfatase activity
VHQVAWFEGNSGYCTHSVGEKKMNELGLFDMSGNIAEFCWDFYGDYSLSREQNYSAQSKGRYRIVRGGSWYGEAHLARPSSRYYASVDLKTDFIGFRVLRSK